MLPVPSLQMVQCAWITIKRNGARLYGFLLFITSDHFFSEYLNGEGLADLEGWTGGRCEIFILQSPSAQWIDYARSNNTLWWKLFSGVRSPAQTTGSDLVREILGDWWHGLSPKLGLASSPILSESEIGPSIQEPVSPSLPPVGAASEYWKNVLKLQKTGINKDSETDERFLLPFEDVKDEHLLAIDGEHYSIKEIFLPCINQFQHTQEIQNVLYRFNLQPTDHPCLLFFRDLTDTNAWFVDLRDLLNQPVSSLRGELKDWFAGREFRGLLEGTGLA